MKVFIYHVFLNDQNLLNYNTRFADLNRLHQHLDYLYDTYDHLKKFETKNPDEADYFFAPLFLTGWQFVKIGRAHV